MIRSCFMLAIVVLLVVSCTSESVSEHPETQKETVVRSEPPVEKTPPAAVGNSPKATVIEVPAVVSLAKHVELKGDSSLPVLNIRPWLIEMRSRLYFYTNGAMGSQSSNLTFECRVYFDNPKQTVGSLVDFRIEKAITDTQEQLKSLYSEGPRQFEHWQHPGSRQEPAFHHLSTGLNLPILPATKLTILQGKVEIAWPDSPVEVMTFSCQPEHFEKRITFNGMPDEYYRIDHDERGYIGRLVVSPGMMGHLKLIEFNTADGKSIEKIRPNSANLRKGVIWTTVYRQVMEGGSIDFHYYPRIRRQATVFTIRDMPLPVAIIRDKDDLIEIELTPVTPVTPVTPMTQVTPLAPKAPLEPVTE